MNNIYILGLHDGHNCGATLTENGKVVASVCEERLTRKKNEVGYPRRAVDEVLKIGGITAAQLQKAVYASLFMHSKEYLTDLAPWYKVGNQEQKNDKEKPKEYQKIIFEQRKAERINAVTGHLGIAAEQVAFTEHHLAHLAAAYYTAPNARDGEAVLGLTCDGSGDNVAATVSICRGNHLERIAVTGRDASLGKIYSRVTMMMGMTPWEHEYKLMGLAPYADQKRAAAAAEPLHKLLKISDDGLRFEMAGELSTNYCYNFLREIFEGVRFDTVAAATQLFTEDMLLAWVRGCIEQTGIHNIVCGGGVFMNIKANMLLGKLPEVHSCYIMPSGGDESLSIGAALHEYYQSSGALEHRASVFEHLYLGGEFRKTDEEQAIDQLLSANDVEISVPDDIDIAVAELLAEKNIVARCKGKMEWGARALGNRSILASADDYRVVDKINEMIKMRDFWMPFAPSIIEECAGDYIEIDKPLYPYFMMFAYEANPLKRSDLIAGSHPRDRTIRPQIVTRAANPDYHKLIAHFKKLTGRGAVLNTSFNLHGYPIVYSPQDAIHVFLNSGLEYLALNHFLIRKRNPGGDAW
ncbi:MAG: carbamoyltransferase C-terminal domain-containing protein [Gammaproteobacteria bacterium]